MAQWLVLSGTPACVESHDVTAAGAAGQAAEDSSEPPSHAAQAGIGGGEPEDVSRKPPRMEPAVPACDAAQCAPSPLGGVGAPCCTLDGKCGLDMQALGFPSFCLERDAPGAPDSSCPGMTVQGLPVAGCCRADSGTCGLTADLLGLGCTLNPQALGQACAAPPAAAN